MESGSGKKSQRWRLTVEVPLFLYSAVIFLNTTAVQNLYLQKLCSPDQHMGVDEVCHKSESVTEAADLNTMRTILRDCVSGVAVLLAGSWRDRTGLTRPLLVLALVGETIANGVVISGYFWWSLSPWVVASVEGSIISVTGGRQLLTMASFCYIADHTPNEQRTSRLNMLMVALLGGASISTATSGYILSAINYPLLLLLGMVLLILCIGLCFVFVKEEPKQQQSENKGFNFSSMKVLFHSRPNNSTVWVMLISVILLASSLTGEASLFVYYLMEGFNFSVKQQGLYLSLRVFVGFAGSLIFSPLASDIFKWSDLTIVIACLSISTFCLICTAFAKTVLQLCLFTLLEWSRIIFLPVCKSIMSKLLKPSELGVFFSLCTIGEAAVPLAILPVFDSFFKATVNTFPGAFFLLSAGTNIFIMAMLWSLVFCKCNKKEPDTEKQDNELKTNKDLTLNKGCDNAKNIEVTNSSQIESEITKSIY